MLDGYRARDGLGWNHPRLQLVDLQYSDVRAERGLYNRLAAGGRMKRLLHEPDVLRAVTEPPEDTRAYFRGRCLRQYPDAVAAASWDSVIFDVPGRESLQRVPTLEPLRGTKAHVGDLLDRCETAAELVAALTGKD
jgi:proteasome accessory factor A